MHLSAIKTVEQNIERLSASAIAQIAQSIGSSALLQLKNPHGDFKRWWQAAEDSYHFIHEHFIDEQQKLFTPELDRFAPRLTAALKPKAQQELKAMLMGLHPFRKGPIDIAGVLIDSEWRSNLKWERLAEHIDLKGKNVLDIGCGNGYYMLRMLGLGARTVTGIDPSFLFFAQWHLFSKLLEMTTDSHAHYFPVGLEDLPKPAMQTGGPFDYVFSMGVLYHRRSPLEHLQHTLSLLRPGGHLVIETLVVDGDETTVFIPQGRYAQMNNVWFLPSAKALSKWLGKCGFATPHCIDISKTNETEQRSTEWMKWHSLKNYLCSTDSTQTIEGHPAPLRGLLIAQRPA